MEQNAEIEIIKHRKLEITYNTNIRDLPAEAAAAEAQLLTKRTFSDDKER